MKHKAVVGFAVLLMVPVAISSLAGASVVRPKVPGAPTSVTAVPADTAMFVSWQPPLSDGTAPIAGYKVIATARGESTEGCTTTTATSCVVSGLVNPTKKVKGAYTIEVSALNSVGAGKPAKIRASASTSQNCSYLGQYANLQNCDLEGANLAGVDLSYADLAGVESGYITGAPTALPRNWNLNNGYLTGPGADLAGADLHQADLYSNDLAGVDAAGADLSEADLQYADLSDANLTGTDLVGASLDDLANANLTNANLTGATLDLGTVTGANLTGANLSEANLDNVTSGSVTGSPSELPQNWNLVDGYLVGPLAWLQGANLGGSNLSDDDLSEVNMTGANLSGVNFTDANLFGAVLKSASLTNAIWSSTTCPDQTLSTADGGTCVNDFLPSTWTLYYTYLLRPDADLATADLYSADIPGVDLAGANLYQVDAQYANLTGADLAGADLEQASLGQSGLADANLSDANLTGADLVGSTLTGTEWSNTTCPDGTNSNSDGGTCMNNF